MCGENLQHTQRMDLCSEVKLGKSQTSPIFSITKDQLANRRSATVRSGGIPSQKGLITGPVECLVELPVKYGCLYGQRLFSGS